MKKSRLTESQIIKRPNGSRRVCQFRIHAGDWTSVRQHLTNGALSMVDRRIADDTHEGAGKKC